MNDTTGMRSQTVSQHVESATARWAPCDTVEILQSSWPGPRVHYMSARVWGAKERAPLSARCPSTGRLEAFLRLHRGSREGSYEARQRFARQVETGERRAADTHASAAGRAGKSLRVWYKVTSGIMQFPANLASVRHFQFEVGKWWLRVFRMHSAERSRIFAIRCRA